MKTSTICLGFLLCIGSVVLPSEEEERQLDLSTLFAGGGISGLSGITSLLLGGNSAFGSLIGGTGGKAGKDGKGSGPLGSLFGGKGGKAGKDGKGSGPLGILFGGKGGKAGKDGKGSGLLGGLFGGGEGGKGLFGGKGKGKRRSLKLEELSKNRGLLDGALSGLLGTVTDGIGAVTDGKGGKGKDGKGKDGKGKDGKGKDGKGKDGKGKDGKGKGSESVGSSLLDTLSNNLLGQIIQAALNLLTGALGRSDVAVEPRIDLSSVAPLPNPLTDPLGFITNPMISAIITAMVGGDIAGMLKAQGDLAGYLITQFITNAITG